MKFLNTIIQLKSYQWSFNDYNISPSHNTEWYSLIPYESKGIHVWTIGTDLIWKKGAAAANNCAFITTDNLKLNPEEPFLFMMDMSMLGVGVGGDTRGAGSITIKEPIVSKTIHSVEDTREGWVEAMRLVLRAYFRGEEIPSFSYEKIRPEGTPLITMGGIAPGPRPLIDGIANVGKLLQANIGKEISSEVIVDLFNYVGKCVVSGGIRRTAQIMFGDSEDKDYLDLKNPEKNSEALMDRRWASNNSIIALEGMDYSDVAERTAKNGEPGYIWLGNMQEFGRMMDGPNDDDWRVQGSNPCSEQSLEDHELCCLVETYPVNHKDKHDYKKTLTLAMEYAKTVTLIPTHNEQTNAVMMRNRRVGVSMSGITQAMTKFGRREFFEGFCNDGYNFLKSRDEAVSEEFCIPKSIKITSVKPSGTVSLLAGVTPGIHYPQSEYYIRRIRFDKTSPYWKILEEAGYDVEDSAYGDGTKVVSFPVKEKYFDRAVSDVSMWEQLENTAQMQHYWADNQVSVTINFKADEAKDIKKALELYETRLKSVSFLPLSEHGYKQAPYEPISKEKFEELSKPLKEYDLNKGTHDSEDKFCDGESCQI